MCFVCAMCISLHMAKYMQVIDVFEVRQTEGQNS